MRERETARAAPAPAIMQRQHVPPCAPRGLGEIEVLLVAGKAVEEQQRGMRSRTGGCVEQRVHCSIPRRDHQRRHGRRVCGIARWIDGCRRLDLRGRLPRETGSLPRRAGKQWPRRSAWYARWSWFPLHRPGTRTLSTVSPPPPAPRLRACAAVTSQTCKALVDALARHGVEIGDDFIPEGPRRDRNSPALILRSM